MFLHSGSGFRAAFALCLLAANQASAAGTLKAPFKSTLASGTTSLYNASAPLANAALKVVATVQAGDNQTFSEVLIDTGSAILWVGGESAYVPGAYTQVTNQTFSVGYGAGGVSGTAYIDRVTIGSATVDSQIIGAANWSYGFTLEKPIDGILGLGPSGSNAGEVSGYTSTPTFVESLVAEGTIEKPVFGIYVSPLSETGVPEGSGEIAFGGVDESKISGDVTWLEQTEPINFHWEFNASSFSWGDQVLASGSIAARTDTGVLPIAVPNDGFFTIVDSVAGATIDNHSALEGCIIFPSNMTADNLPDLGIGIGNLNFSIPASRYIVPTSLFGALNITDNMTHTWIAPGGPEFFDLGQKFLEGAYSAYDMENHLVGFAYLA
ncbi:acid protease [Laetiporus sulphureus 93-53]|uniref:Acid protease n=1 Tax=Laetiporus sulphureus 93-53 TaxID=1314785 RepID=A0A165BNX3_9APHY|nr:acid protease [Laetiporus sulphureus 93-53]KZT01388.1 acid protease [Laetiporus sulphureus 93-53]